jgi:hypothetical protein
VKREQPDAGFGGGGTIPQRDGPADDGAAPEGDDAVQPADEDAAAAAAVDDDEDPLSSDSEEEEDEEEGEMEHFLCCQFEKVSRAKSKWKVKIQEGVFHINGGCAVVVAAAAFGGAQHAKRGIASWRVFSVCCHAFDPPCIHSLSWMQARTTCLRRRKGNSTSADHDHDHPAQ